MKTLRKSKAKTKVLKEPSTISPYQAIVLNKEKLLQAVEEINVLQDLHGLKSKVQALKAVIISPNSDQDGLVNITADGDTISWTESILDLR